MKKLGFLAVVVLVLLIGMASAGTCCASRYGEDRIYMHSFNFRGDDYRTYFTFDQVKDYSNKEITEIKLPKTFPQIIDIAINQAKKIDNNSEWRVYSVTLDKYSYSSSEFWFYRISLRNADNAYIDLIATLDGQMGKLVKLKEIPIE